MKIEIYYMSGAGNLFTVTDNRIKNLDLETGQKLAPILCNSEIGFDTDGLMFLNSGTSEFDFTSEFFNPDGSNGMMCGNGGRCIARFANSKIGFDRKHIKFSMAGNPYAAEFKISNIKLKLPPPSEITDIKSIQIDNQIYEYNYVNVGTDHCVIKVDNLANFDVEGIGNKIRNHIDFSPNGANINFYEIKENKVHLRTFERGVEKETGACGTGAIATGIVVNRNDKMLFPIRIMPSSNSELIIDLDVINPTVEAITENIRCLYLEGNALILDKKVVEVDL